MDAEGITEVFSILGLSRFSAEVYFKLLEKGPMSLSSISEELHVKAPQVHQYLKELIAQGLVEVSYGKPNLYRAVSPHVLEKLIESKVVELKTSVIERLKQMYQAQIQTSKTSGNSHLVYILRNWKSYLNRALEVAESANIDLIVCGDMLFIEKVIEIIKSKERNGVNTYVLVYEVPGISIDVNKLAEFSRVKKYVSGDLLVIADTHTATIAQRRRGPFQAPSYGLIVEEPVVIDYLEHDFFYRWTRGDVIREELVKIPTAFTAYRLALYEINRLIKHKCRPEVTVHGIWTRDGSKCTIKGTVIDVVFDKASGISQLVLNTTNGKVTVGAQDAIIEDIAAYKVEVTCT